MTGPFQEPKSFTAVACGTERIVPKFEDLQAASQMRRQAVINPDLYTARQAKVRARLNEAIAATFCGIAVFIFAMTFGFYWRHGFWVWELGAW